MDNNNREMDLDVEKQHEEITLKFDIFDFASVNSNTGMRIQHGIYSYILYVYPHFVFACSKMLFHVISLLCLSTYFFHVLQMIWTYLLMVYNYLLGRFQAYRLR